MPKLDVLTIGSATRDLFLESAQFRIIRDPSFSTGEAECFALGSKVEIPRIVDETGGGATNAAVGFARLGLKAGAAIRLGNDHRGQAVAEEVRDEGVRVFATIDRVHRTAISVLLLTGRGERTVLVHRGASAHLTAADIPRVSTAWYYVTSLAGSRSALSEVRRRADRSGAGFAWNPGADELAWGMSRVRRFLPGTVLNLNRFEAEQLTGEAKPERAVRSLLKAGAKTVVITAGKDGAVAGDGTGMYRAGVHRVSVVSTTGAGDAFGAGFVTGIIRGWRMAQCLQLGTANSESVIRHIRAKPGLRRSMPKVSERVRVERIGA